MSAPVREPWRPKTTADRVKFALLMAGFYVDFALLFRWMDLWIEPRDPRELAKYPAAIVAIAAILGGAAGWIASFTPTVITYRWRVLGTMTFWLLAELDRFKVDHGMRANIGLLCAIILTSLIMAGLWTWIDRVVAPAWKARLEPPSSAE